MVVCCVPGCAGKGTKMFHSFPKDPDVREKWINNTKTFHLNEKQLDSYGKICKYHFRETDFEINARGQQGLKKGTVPSLNLPSSDVMLDDVNNMHDSDDAFVPHKKQRKRHVTDVYYEPLPNPQIPKKDDDILVDPINNLDEVSQNQSVTVSLEEIKKFQKIAEDCIVFEQKIKDFEQIINEMKRNEKKNESMISKLLKKDQINQKKAKKLRQELRDEKKHSKRKIMEHLSNIFNSEQLAFFSMQFKNSGKKPNGRRFSLEEKGLSLMLYKYSPKNYRNMRKMFILPSKRTLGRFSAHLIFHTGIDKKLFAHIKEKVRGLSELDTYCTLSWDEVSLKAHLDYSISRDEIDGFVDMINLRRPTFATHALTFMIRGIKIPFKQPIGYFFTHGLKYFELTEMITLMTEAVLDTGLKVMASTCDQVGVNVAAIHQLMDPNCVNTSKGGLLTYEIRGNIVIHCYDPPHLIKGIRNNLMTKNLKHQITKRWSISSGDFHKSVKKQKARIASWDHVADFRRYTLRASTKLLPKISPEHINPNKSKMKVSVATQVFSETFGNLMLKYADNGTVPRNYSDTAEIMLFFNDLFDSINGACQYDSNKLKGPVTENSVHFSFWDYALDMLSKMNFYDKSTGKLTNRTSVLKHFESTIKGYNEICTKCLNLNMTEISIRNMNQDALENFFGCVRSCCQNASSLIATHYRAAYVTMFINNLSSAHSIKSNCEPDISTPLLTQVHSFFLNYNNDEEPNGVDNNESFDDDVLFDPLHNFSHTYSVINNEDLTTDSSLICDKMLNITKCVSCRKNLETAVYNNDKDNLDIHDTPKRPSDIFMINFKRIVCGIKDILPDICTEKCLKIKLLEQLDKIEILKMGCSKHFEEVASKFKEQITLNGIVTFTKNINDLLSGKIKTLPPDYNSIEKLAYIFYKKKKGIGKFSGVLKK